jgi:hypothetical protein
MTTTTNPSSLLKKLCHSLLIGCALLLTIPSQASVPTKTGTAVKKVTKKGSSKKVAPPSIEIDDGVPDTQDAIHTEYNCELGNKVSVYHKTDEKQYISLRWKQRLLRLTRVETTTGAERFESLKHGLVWIGIPAKGILLDSAKGRQLANDCKSAAQVQLGNPVTTN